MPVTKAQIQSKSERDRINLAMRATPEWRNAIKAMGLNPDGPLRLTKNQQQQMASVFGIPANAGKVDASGNLADFGGWKGLPTWAKTAIIVGGAVATGGAGGMFSGAPGAFGLGGAGAGGAAGAVGGIDATIGGMGAGGVSLGEYGAAAGGGGALNALKKGARSLSARDWLDLAFKGAEIGTGIWGANKASDASKEAAEIEAAAYREGLDFLKTQWAKYNEDFKPYLDAGQASVRRMSAAMEGTSAPAMPASVAARMNGTPTLGTFGQPRPTTPPVVLGGPTPAPTSTKMPVPKTGGPTGAPVNLGSPQNFPEGARPGDPVYLGGTGINGGMVVGHYGPDGKPVYDKDSLRGPDGQPVSRTQPPLVGPTPGTEDPNAPAPTGPGQRIDSEPVGRPTLGNYGQPPVSGTMPVRETPRFVKMQIRPGMIKDVPLDMVDRWTARGAQMMVA